MKQQIEKHKKKHQKGIKTNKNALATEIFLKHLQNLNKPELEATLTGTGMDWNQLNW